MTEILPITFSILVAVISILSVAGIAYLIFALIKRKDTDKPLSLSVNLLFKIYLYLISFITLILVVVGGATLIRSALSYAIDISFSYPLTAPNNVEPAMTKPVYPEDSMYTIPECYNGTTMEIKGQKVCFDEESRKQDLINGTTLLISMAIIFAIHQYGIYLSEKKSKLMWLKKIYLFTNLVIFSIAGIISIPTSIYAAINYYLFSSDLTLYNRQIPGISIGIVILVLPLWIYFLIKTQRLQEDQEEKENLQKK